MPASIIETMQIRPTTLSSVELRRLRGEFGGLAMRSARVTSATYLQRMRGILAGVASGGASPQAARTRLRSELAALGYTPGAGFPGDAARGVPPAPPESMRDLSSAMRLNLQVDTVQRQAAALRQKAEGASSYAQYAYPGWHFVRAAEREIPRNWLPRWAAAGRACGWDGASQTEMTALKTSPIWAELGAGAGGYEDTLGTDYPPFAFGSGMEWREADRELCLRLGLIEEDYDPGAQTTEGASGGLDKMASAFDRLDPDIRAALLKELEDA